MKIGFICDGIAEFGALPLLHPKIPTAATMGPVVVADLDPRAPVGNLLLRCRQQIENVLLVKGVTRTVVLLDLDGRVPCARTWAIEFQTALSQEFDAVMPHGAYFVLKNGSFENWLISDVDSVGALAKFNFSNAEVAQIRANADGVNAAKILSNATRAASRARGRNYDYEKTGDALSIFSVAKPLVMAASSRSFRRYLRVVGCNGYGSANESRTIIPSSQIVAPAASRLQVGARARRRARR